MEWDLGRRLVPEYNDVSLFPCFLSPCKKLVLLTLLCARQLDQIDQKYTLRFYSHLSTTTMYSTLSKAVRDGITGSDLVEQ